jgi:hypothetical protein
VVSGWLLSQCMPPVWQLIARPSLLTKECSSRHCLLPQICRLWRCSWLGTSTVSVMRPEDVWGGASNLGNKGAAGAPQLASMLAAAGLQDVWGTMIAGMATGNL